MTYELKPHEAQPTDKRRRTARVLFDMFGDVRLAHEAWNRAMQETIALGDFAVMVGVTHLVPKHAHFPCNGCQDNCHLCVYNTD
jgi:hypothetical protein